MILIDMLSYLGCHPIFSFTHFHKLKEDSFAFPIAFAMLHMKSMCCFKLKEQIGQYQPKKAMQVPVSQLLVAI